MGNEKVPMNQFAQVMEYEMGSKAVVHRHSMQ